MKRFPIFFVLLASLSLPLFAGGSQDASKPEAAGGGEWSPARPIDIVVPYAPGGSSDLLGRAIEKAWTKYCPQPARIVTKPGGAGVTGSVFVSNSAPDGYTLCLAFGSGPDMTMQYLQKMDYDPFKALDPLVLVSIHSLIIAAPVESEFKTLTDLVTWSKKNKEPITVAISTAKGMVDLMLQTFATRTGTDLIIIPHEGSAQAVTALISGQTMIGCAHPSDLLPQIKAGRLRLLAVASEQRDPAFPDLPTLKEQGFDYSCWGALKAVAVPKNMPDNIKRYYEQLFQQICGDPVFINDMKELAQPILYEDIETFTRTFRQANSDYKKIIEDLGLAYYQQKS
ncbi:MAG: tripartite tricarboxylate transporter substrate binding protein [Spirochaetales bacterium]|nr:tripartite tricarboxylate transporter substrate binding protein [Spirochaetales bacterium]